jgi:hypothetical protein
MSRLDQSKATIQTLSALESQFESDPTSFSGFLKDPLSQSIIEKSAKVLGILKDHKNYSQLEEQRAAEDLANLKASLLAHIGQLKQVEEVNLETLRVKKDSLQRSVLFCIDREIASLMHQIERSADERRRGLLDEKEILQEKMEELRLAAAELPERWKVENWLELRLDVGKKIMTILTQLVESKTVERHLHAVESKPLDAATPPIEAKKPYLCLCLLFGGCCGSLCVFSLALIPFLRRGFPLTRHSLAAMGYPYQGEVTDLETMRKLTLFIGDHKVVGLLGGQGPDYSHSFAQHLRNGGRKVLLIRCDFKTNSRGPGLLQWLEQGTQPPRVDHTIFSGGSTVYGMEFLKKPAFRQLLDESQKEYDLILLWQAAPLDSAQTISFLSHCDAAIATIVDERVEQLIGLDKCSFVVPRESL